MGLTDEDRRSLRGSGNVIDPITAPIAEAVRISGLSRSEIYRRLTAGDIVAVKNGSRTLIVMASVRDYLARLPIATFRAPAAAPNHATN
jgi:hypothetical protein